MSTFQFTPVHDLMDTSEVPAENDYGHPIMPMSQNNDYGHPIVSTSQENNYGHPMMSTPQDNNYGCPIVSTSQDNDSNTSSEDENSDPVLPPGCFNTECSYGGGAGSRITGIALYECGKCATKVCQECYMEGTAHSGHKKYMKLTFS